MNKSIEDNVYVKLCGGLGNQLFQIANGYAYSLRYNKNFFVLKYWDGRPDRPNYWNSLLKNLQPYLKDLSEFKGILYKEPTWEYKEIPYIKGDVIFEGYFQCEKYFEDYSENVRKLFNIYPEKYENSFSVGIHIRRGDYLKCPDFHYVLQKEYYDKAKEFIKSKINSCNYIYFSEDTEWVKETFKHDIDKDDKIISGLSDIEEFKLMINCKGFIIANSTFGWWASWFSQSELIVAPKNWFGPLFNESWNSIYRNSFTIV
jgi:hypothetical protein